MARYRKAPPRPVAFHLACVGWVDGVVLGWFRIRPSLTSLPSSPSFPTRPHPPGPPLSPTFAPPHRHHRPFRPPRPHSQPTTSPTDPTAADDSGRRPRPRGECFTSSSSPVSLAAPSGTSSDASVSTVLLYLRLSIPGLEARRGESTMETEDSRGLTSPRAPPSPPSPSATESERAPMIPTGAPPAITSTHEYQALENEWMRERNVSHDHPIETRSQDGQDEGGGRREMSSSSPTRRVDLSTSRSRAFADFLTLPLVRPRCR